MTMEIWNKINRPPPTALKEIKGGRLKGKSDINPQWRMQAMTEVFGICGIGWAYEITRLWTEPGDNGQVFAFAEIHLFIKKDNEWSRSIPGIGGSMLIVNEASKPHSNDEAYKMATTDALSVAMKSLGMAADIYFGLWDGSKYKTQAASITATTGAWDKVSADMKIYLPELAAEAKGFMEGGSIRGACEVINMAELSADEKTAVWDLFNSKERSAMKLEFDVMKQEGAAK